MYYFSALGGAIRVSGPSTLGNDPSEEGKDRLKERVTNGITKHVHQQDEGDEDNIWVDLCAILPVIT